jgi:hypothetical protein
MVLKKRLGCVVVVVVNLTGLRTGTAEIVTKRLPLIRRGTLQTTTVFPLLVWAGNFLKMYGLQSRLYCLWRAGSALH